MTIRNWECNIKHIARFLRIRHYLLLWVFWIGASSMDSTSYLIWGPSCNVQTSLCCLLITNSSYWYVCKPRSFTSIFIWYCVCLRQHFYFVILHYTIVFISCWLEIFFFDRSFHLLLCQRFNRLLLFLFLLTFFFDLRSSNSFHVFKYLLCDLSLMHMSFMIF